MRENLTSESYKRIYENIQPSEDLRKRIRMRTRRRRRWNHRYAAALVVLVLTLGGGSVYAYTHPALIRAFLGEQADRQLAEKLYLPVEKSISCDGYVYTAEGHIYNDEIGIGYLSIRIQKEDGTVPSVAYGGGRTPSNAYALDVDGNQVLLGFHTGFRVCFTNVESDGDKAYFYMKYIPVDNSRTLSLYAISYSELMKLHPEETAKSVWDWDADLFEEACANCEDIEIPHQTVDSRKYVTENLTAIVGPMDFYAAWNEQEIQIDTIALIDGRGERQEILMDGIVISNGNWAGYQLNREEDDTITLYYPLQNLTVPEEVRVEINGEVLAYKKNTR